jgi:type IX secretion system PorP/SprF family membrane protein
MKKILFCLSALIAFSEASKAQDVHFTQYFTSPMTLNPALTGLTQSDFRMAANYRSQWGSVNNTPYTTGTFSYDMASMRGQFANGDYLGFGLLGLYDKSGTGSLQNITIGISAAYHKCFGVDKQHSLSFGIQGSLVQKSIDQNKLVFGNEIDPRTGEKIQGFSGDPLGNKDLTYPDFAAGLIYSGRVSEHASLFGGISAYHLTRPVETFLGSSYKLHSRIAGYIGTQIDMNDHTVLYASALYQKQGGNVEALIGGAVGFVMNPGYDKEFQKASIFYLGSWYRYGDAVMPYVGFEWAKMQLGISYDANLSSFTPATNGNGAFELSLIFNGSINKIEPAQRFNTACPKF